MDLEVHQHDLVPLNPAELNVSPKNAVQLNCLLTLV